MLNYRQLHYFWAVAKTGSIARASEQLNLTPQTISGQISLLEQTYGLELFQRVGRQLELTETGRQTLIYAEQMFQLGNELEAMPPRSSVSVARTPRLTGTLCPRLQHRWRSARHNRCSRQ